MQWYYSKGNERLGPVSPEELIAIQQDGGISGATLVWREGQGDWKEFREVADIIFAAVGEGMGVAETAVCAHSGKVMPRNEMVPYGDAWVAPEHKDAFVQRLMEGDRMKLSEAGEYALQYVGFWWRVLGSMIDYFVKFIPVLICQIPYLIASGFAGVEVEPEDPNPFSIWTTAMLLTYMLAMGGQLVISVFYDTWMVGKYQATVGKMAIGAVVVNPDGSRVTYGKSFGRWAAKKLLNWTITMAVLVIPMVLIGFIAFGSSMGGGESPDPDKVIGLMVLIVGSMLVLYPLGLFPFWMCGLDAKKRALHDRVCATRVVKKRVSG